MRTVDVDLIDAEIYRKLQRKHMRYHWVNPIILALIVAAVYYVVGAYIGGPL